MLTAVKKTFDLIWFVPDNVLRWFAGLNQIGLGRTGADIANDALGGATSATRQMTPAASNAAIGGSAGTLIGSGKAAKAIYTRVQANRDSTDEGEDSAVSQQQPAQASVETLKKRDKPVRGTPGKESIEENPKKL